jgi:hypothetical protein
MQRVVPPKAGSVATPVANPRGPDPEDAHAATSIVGGIAPAVAPIRASVAFGVLAVEVGWLPKALRIAPESVPFGWKRIQ